jgi:hypothetical protein
MCIAQPAPLTYATATHCTVADSTLNSIQIHCWIKAADSAHRDGHERGQNQRAAEAEPRERKLSSAHPLIGVDEPRMDDVNAQHQHQGTCKCPIVAPVDDLRVIASGEN